MAAQKGKALLLRIGDGGTPEAFSSVAGLRSKAISFNAGLVDITNAGSASEWRELLAGAGVKTATVSGSGVFKDAASDETVRTAFFTQTLPNWEIVIPGFGTVMGPFQVTALEYAGEYDGQATYSLTLESAGALSFTAEEA